MIREVGESFGNAVLDGVGRLAGRAQERRPLPTDLLESDDAYLVVFDAPDADAADVQVRFSGNTVHVRIDRVREHREGFEMRFPGRGLALDGEVTLPEGTTVDPDGATATMTNTGTLEVEIPKTTGADEPVRISTEDSHNGTDVGTDEDGLDVEDANAGDDPDAYDAEPDADGVDDEDDS